MLTITNNNLLADGIKWYIVFQMNFPWLNISGLSSYISMGYILVQGRRNSSALAMELRLSCTTPSIFNV